MKMYRTWYDDRIEEVEVIKQTEKFVTTADGRWKTRSLDLYNFFSSWQEAHDFLVSREIANIEQLQARISQCNDKMTRLAQMVHP